MLFNLEKLEEKKLSDWGKWNWLTEIVFASMREDMFLGFQSMQDSNHPAELQGFARKLTFCV